MCKNSDYWTKRKDHIYLLVVRTIVEQLGKKAQSVIDVGSNGCPYLEWFDWVDDRTSIDIRNPYSSATVDSVKADFLDWEPDKKYDMSLCLQVLEHVDDAFLFAQKLLDLSELAVVSVPYKWPAGRTTGHIHDPVDENKMRQWFGREPNFSYIAAEVVSPVSRLICVYERDETIKYRSLRERSRNLSRPRALNYQALEGRGRAAEDRLAVARRRIRKGVSVNGLRRLFGSG